MSKAEEFAIGKYPVSIEDIYGHKVDVNLWQRKACVEGYHQAEKDLELTWKDIVEIETLLNLVRSSAQYKNGYKEVLKRFKDLKK